MAPTLEMDVIGRRLRHNFPPRFYPDTSLYVQPGRASYSTIPNQRPEDRLQGLPSYSSITRSYLGGGLSQKPQSSIRITPFGMERFSQTKKISDFFENTFKNFNSIVSNPGLDLSPKGRGSVIGTASNFRGANDGAFSREEDEKQLGGGSFYSNGFVKGWTSSDGKPPVSFYKPYGSSFSYLMEQKPGSRPVVYLKTGESKGTPALSRHMMRDIDNFFRKSSNDRAVKTPFTNNFFNGNSGLLKNSRPERFDSFDDHFFSPGNQPVLENPAIFKTNSGSLKQLRRTPLRRHRTTHDLNSSPSVSIPGAQQPSASRGTSEFFNSNTGYPRSLIDESRTRNGESSLFNSNFGFSKDLFQNARDVSETVHQGPDTLFGIGRQKVGLGFSASDFGFGDDIFNRYFGGHDYGDKPRSRSSYSSGSQDHRYSF